MVDLQKISGLPIFLDEEKMNLEFNGDFQFIKKSERSLEELRPYLKNPHTDTGPDPVYYVWRYVHLTKDTPKLKKASLRYDLTLIPPGTVDDEFVKTAGHYHKGYPEVYEVLLGQAYFLIQSESNAYATEAGPGEKFLIPPSYGHNTINVSDKPLILANWVSERAVYDYESYKNNHGAMYYFLKNNELTDPALKLRGGVDIIKNPNYESATELKKIAPKEWPQFGLFKNQPLYTLVNNIDKLRVLNYPEEFKLEL